MVLVEVGCPLEPRVGVGYSSLLSLPPLLPQSAPSTEIPNSLELPDRAEKSIPRSTTLEAKKEATGMECEPEELQFLGIAGIYCEAVLILRAHRPLFARIAAAFVLPLSLLFLLHIAISHALFSHIDSDDHALDSAAPGTPTQRRLPRRSVANPLSSRVDGCDLPESKWTQTSPTDPLGSYNDAEWRDWANLGTELTEDIIGRLLALDPVEYIHWIRKEEKGKLSFEGREQGGERDELERAWEKIEPEEK